MADALITDLEITVLCDLLEGPSANLKAHDDAVMRLERLEAELHAAEQRAGTI